MEAKKEEKRMKEEMSQSLDFWGGLKGSRHGTTEENRILLERYRRGEEKAKEELLLKNAKLVRAVMHKYFKHSRIVKNKITDD